METTVIVSFNIMFTSYHFSSITQMANKSYYTLFTKVNKQLLSKFDSKFIKFILSYFDFYLF